MTRSQQQLKQIAESKIRQLEALHDAGKLSGRSIMILSHARQEFGHKNFRQACKSALFALEVASE